MCLINWNLCLFFRWPLLYSKIQESQEVTWFERAMLRLKMANEVEKTLRELSSICHPVGEPPLTVMDKLISGKHPIKEFVEDVLVGLIFNQKK